MANIVTLIPASAIAYTQATTAEGEVKMTKAEIIEMIEQVGIEAAKRNRLYIQVARIGE